MRPRAPARIAAFLTPLFLPSRATLHTPRTSTRTPVQRGHRPPWQWVQIGACLSLGDAAFRLVQHWRIPERAVTWLVVLLVKIAGALYRHAALGGFIGAEVDALPLRMAGSGLVAS